MADPTPNPNPVPVPVKAIPKPVPPPARVGPLSYSIAAGKTVVFVNDKNVVTMINSPVEDIRIFTQWSVNTYADQATALADITAKGWTYKPPSPTK